MHFVSEADASSSMVQHRPLQQAVRSSGTENHGVNASWNSPGICILAVWKTRLCSSCVDVPQNDSRVGA